ncbi:DUF4232 domain-containing protein [Actinoplanes sp. CA-030573]|uniref:DUF4232 domain-containing protein n=1 Tax=Actinoplanes sp. CA-030573 TaxID=3239898 RepID=UPI003D9437DE
MRRLLLLMAAPALLAAGCSAGPASSGTASPDPAISATSATSHPGAPTESSGAGNAAGAGGANGGAASGGIGGANGGSGTPRCHSADLKLSLGETEGAAGSRYTALIFTNASDHTCTLYGFPGVSWVAGDDGHQVNEPFQRDRGTPKVRVTLAKGAAAHATLQTHDVGFFDPGTCKPVDVRGFRVYPPDETKSIFVALPEKACSAKGVNEGVVRAIGPGKAPS